MKKTLSILLTLFLCITGLSFANAKKGKDKNSTILEVDYSTLTAETIVELDPKTAYQISFINLPSNISSTQLKKRFSGKFMNIRSKREKVSDSSSSHRVIVKKAQSGFEGKVRLKLYEKVLADDSNEDDSSGDNGDTASFRTGDDDEDNLLFETIEFTLAIQDSVDDNGSGNGDTGSADIELDYSSLSSATSVELTKSTKSIGFINLPENISSTKLKKKFSGKFANIRSKRETVVNNSSSHRVLLKKKNKNFEGKVELQLFEKSSDSSDDNGDTASFRTSDDEDNILVESIEFTVSYSGGSSDNDSDDDSSDDDSDDDDSEDD